MKHVMFVGRWQPPHRGHVEMWKTGAFDQGFPAVIYIRSGPEEVYTPKQVRVMILATLLDLVEDKEIGPYCYANTEVIIGPDISAVCYGRGVGYKVEEVKIDSPVSGSQIRESLRLGESVDHLVTPSVLRLL